MVFKGTIFTNLEVFSHRGEGESFNKKCKVEPTPRRIYTKIQEKKLMNFDLLKHCFRSTAF